MHRNAEAYILTTIYNNTILNCAVCIPLSAECYISIQNLISSHSVELVVTNPGEIKCMTVKLAWYVSVLLLLL